MPGLSLTGYLPVVGIMWYSYAFTDSSRARKLHGQTHPHK